MSNSRLAIASVILIALVALTFVMVNARSADYKPATTAAEVKLPKIEQDKLDELEVSGPDQPKVRMVKKGDEWRVSEPVDARADQEAVKTAITKLAELKFTGIAATKKENHDRLEVSEAKGTHVVAKSGGKTVLAGYMGTYDSGNTMFRLDGQDPVASVEGSIRFAFRKQAREYRDRVITKIEVPTVQKIVFDNKNGHFEFERDSKVEWKQVLAKGQKRIDPLDISKVKGLLGTASSLNASDFGEPGLTAEQTGLGAGASTATLIMVGDAGVSDIRYRVGIQKDNNYYLQREGNDTIYLVSNWIASRLVPKTDDFIKKDPPKNPPPKAPNVIEAGEQLPPEILRKLQQQQMQQGISPH
jgi:biopolymer transport protein ExbD